MDHDALNRKLTNLEEEISLAQAASLHGSAMLAKASLTLDDAIRVAANIRNRLSGALRAAGKQTSSSFSTE
ncbi:hypothetical protein [Granulicella paludicola]|jgi:hypothetical protein|uniref:hypothetical protein n=1 Tax=Granulicella paludicola TaxID=474951 RepID=UPI0021E0E8DE|nr:hypothetical protein [Granulicella paludicola]